MKATAESQSADFAKGERVTILRPGYRGQAGRVRGLTKDKSRIVVNITGGFVVSVLPEELQTTKENRNE